METDTAMSVGGRILSLINQSENIAIIIAVLAILCLLLGLLIAKRFFAIWQAESLKKRFYRDLISRYENDGGENNESEESVGGSEIG